VKAKMLDILQKELEEIAKHEIIEVNPVKNIEYFLKV
jgi:hypothetical protein